MPVPNKAKKKAPKRVVAAKPKKSSKTKKA
jgi:hypothetical protein